MKITDFVNIYHSEEKDGNMSSKHAGEEIGSKNRKSFLEKHSLDYNNFIYMSVSNDTNFVIINKKEDFNDDSDVKINGVITKNKDLILGLVTADCAPIVMYDKNKEVLVLLHGSMFNIDNGILEKIILQMKSSFNTNPEDILVYIGPSIRKESYKYDKNIFSKLTDNSEIRKTLTKDSDSVYRIDIPQTIKNILIKEGVNENNILDSGIDTYTNKRYSSHVYTWENNLPEFRFLTVVKIKDF